MTSALTSLLKEIIYVDDYLLLETSIYILLILLGIIGL